jgi:hypothetical protein
MSGRSSSDARRRTAGPCTHAQHVHG